MICNLLHRIRFRTSRLAAVIIAALERFHLGELINRIRPIDPGATRSETADRSIDDSGLDERVRKMIAAAEEAGYRLHPDSDPPRMLLWQCVHDEAIVWVDELPDEDM
ncbi:MULTISPECIES: hypothetical protein [unclassified Nocardia]|uniref:hypothetical protein n=1 Tax=unclassified Nocardia TaxID=2637762 RepID=UPI001CE3CA71|nr:MULTISPECIES: hypothetical protein [unclassified Nocardia]